MDADGRSTILDLNIELIGCSRPDGRLPFLFFDSGMTHFSVPHVLSQSTT